MREFIGDFSAFIDVQIVLVVEFYGGNSKDEYY